MKFLRQKTIDVLKLYNYSGMTIRTYVQAISDFAHYHGKSPELLGEEDIKTFLLYSQRRGLAASSMRILRCAIVFFYTEVINRKMEVEHIPSIKQEFRLPLVLSTSEIERLLSVVTDLKHKTILMTFYATGMRLEELQMLKIANIDSDRMVIKFMGKGRRERYVHLSPAFLIQRLLGHQNLATTQKYIFIAKDSITSVKSPLDLLSIDVLKEWAQ
jgi:integrase/recombinase XerD